MRFSTQTTKFRCNGANLLLIRFAWLAMFGRRLNGCGLYETTYMPHIDLLMSSSLIAAAECSQLSER